MRAAVTVVVVEVVVLLGACSNPEPPITMEAGISDAVSSAVLCVCVCEREEEFKEKS